MELGIMALTVKVGVGGATLAVDEDAAELLLLLLELSSLTTF